MSDTTRLAFLMKEIDAFGNVKKDRFDYAAEVAEEEGHNEITEQDELEGFRRLIDASIRIGWAE
ncbi:MAG: hypothetical protein WAW61_22255 [Methylococcaceae bacterium]